MRAPGFGRAWVALALALALHVVDEATHNFLGWYNPTVLDLRSRFPWFPAPTFEFTEWIIGLTIGILLLLSLSGLAFAGGRAMRAVSGVLGVLMTANGLGHMTVSVLNGRLMPGVLSSPVLLACSLWLLYEVIRLGRHPVASAAGAD